MDATLEGLLKAIDMGDADAIGILADWLEERGDPRSLAFREATLPDPVAIARTLLQSRHEEALIAYGYKAWEIPGALDLPPEQGVEPALITQLWGVCLADVKQALATRKLSSEIVHAIRTTRRLKIDELLKLFKEVPSAS